MLRLNILSVGKTKEVWLEAGIKEYLKRLQNVLKIDFTWAKNDDHLITLCSKEAMLIGLDPVGRLMTSEEFSSFLIKTIEYSDSRLAMVIGGADGLPTPLKQCKHLISLSPLTFTHQLCRLILIEQIYRAFEIDKGSRYHK